MQRSSRGSCALDAEVACGQGCGVGLCGEHSERDGASELEKNELKPWKNKAWCIPELSGEFVARMEDVLDLYEEEYDTERPVVCFDETSKQLIARTHENAD